VLAGTRVTGDERRQPRVRTLDQPGWAAIVHAAAALRDVIEQLQDRVAQRRPAARRKKGTNLVQRVACLNRRKQPAGFEPPYEVRNVSAIGIQGEAIALLELFPAGYGLPVREQLQNRLCLDPCRRVLLRRAEAVCPEPRDPYCSSPM
jgi:hypothetical protein